MLVCCSFVGNEFGPIRLQEIIHPNLIICILLKIFRQFVEGVECPYGSRLHALAIAQSVTAIAEGGHQPPTQV